MLLDGPAGALEVFVDQPPAAVRGLAIVAHPQPLRGGHAQHKIPQLLARALAEAGWRVMRPNFRGVGGSAGTHDEGRGESADVLALATAMRAAWPGLPLALVGFSFGAYVQARVSRALADQGERAWRTALIGMPFGVADSGRSYPTPDGQPAALVVHGERDASVPLASVLDWARPSGQPVIVVPGADHFLTGRLPLMRSLVLEHLREAPPAGS